MKKVVLLLVILAAFAICIPSARAQITAQQRNDAINAGLEYLADRQQETGDGSLYDAGCPYPVALTALAVLKWEEHANKFLKKDPFSNDNPYKDNIVAGWKYIFQNAVVININIEHGGDNPDVNRVNGKGVYFLSPGRNRPLYETGMVMMALEASRHPEFIVDALGSPVNDSIYLNVMKDAVDYVSWAQNDEPNSGRGGWRYGAYDDGALVLPGLGAPLSDNSVTQWPKLGLMSAGLWGISAPAWVETELNYWLVYSQAGDGGFWYYGPGSWENVALTASGMIQLTNCGKKTTDPEMQNAISYISTNWATGGNDPNIPNLYAMYTVMKASMLAEPEPIVKYGDHNWQNEYDEWLITNQNLPGGYWPGDSAVVGTGGTNSPILATEFALLILQKVAPIEPQPGPSFNQWGLISLILVLLALATWVFFWRRKVVGVR